MIVAYDIPVSYTVTACITFDTIITFQVLKHRCSAAQTIEHAFLRTRTNVLQHIHEVMMKRLKGGAGFE